MITLVNAKPFLFLSILPFFFKRFIYVLVVKCSIMVGRWDYTREGNKLYKDMNRLSSLLQRTINMGWVNRNVDPSHTQVFFQGASPVHY